MTVFDVLKIKHNTTDPKIIKKCNEILDKWHKKIGGKKNGKIENSKH